MIHKMIHNILNIKAAVTYVPYQDLENKFMLLSLLEQPEEFGTMFGDIRIRSPDR